MITKIVILLIIGLICATAGIVFISNKKVKLIIGTLVLSVYFAMLTLGVFASGTNFSNMKIHYTGQWFAKDILWSPLPANGWDLFINIIMLIPMGLYIGAFAEKPLLKSLLIGFGTSFFIELMQFILPVDRLPQLSDVLINTLSSVFGCLYAMCFVWIKNRFLTKKKPKEMSVATDKNTIKNTDKEVIINSIPQTINNSQKQENVETETIKKEEKKQKTSK